MTKTHVMKFSYQTFINDKKICKFKITDEEMQRIEQLRITSIITVEDIDGNKYELKPIDYIVINCIGK